MATDLWMFRSGVGNERTDLEGLTVEAIDGKLGKVDEVVTMSEGTYLVVDTGPLGLGKTTMLPSGLVTGIDVDDEVIHVDRTKDEVKNAPAYDADHREDPAYVEALTRHYGAVKPHA
jgi:hypothetical protein